MSDTIRFERSHDILIDAPAGDVLDYVSNPNSWPEWIAASHHIDSPDRPLDVGDTFQERWHTRTGEVLLDWVVADAGTRTCGWRRPRRPSSAGSSPAMMWK